MEDAHKKLEKLKSIIKGYKKVVVAFSGGADSTFLAKVCSSVLGKNALAVTADSDSMPRKELEETKALARKMGMRHVIVKANELQNEAYTINPTNRCYFCKTELYRILTKIAEKEKINVIANGLNKDDTEDYRPGIQADKEFHIKSPMVEAGLTKREIRFLSRESGLPTHDKPASPCLSSRVAYGVSITKHRLNQVESAEEFLRQLGFKEFRVRHHGQIARIEIPENDFDLLFRHRKEIADKLKELGFAYITLDLQGFRSGSMNEMLNKEILIHIKK